MFYFADCNCAETVQRTHSTHAICKIHMILNLLMNGVYNQISIPPVLILPSPMGRRLLLFLEFFNKISVRLSLLARAFYMSHAVYPVSLHYHKIRQNESVVNILEGAIFGKKGLGKTSTTILKASPQKHNS